MADDIYDSKAYDSSEEHNGNASQSQSEPTSAQENHVESEQIYRPAPEYGAYGPVDASDANNGDANKNSGDSNHSGESLQNQEQIGANGASVANSANSRDYANSEYGNGLDNPFLPYGDPYNANGEQKRTRFGNPYDLSDDNSADSSTESQPAEASNQVPDQASSQTTSQNPNVVYKKRGFKAESKENSTIMVAIVSSIISAIVCVVVMAFVLTQGLIPIPGAGTLADVGAQSPSKGTAVVKGGQSPDWRSVAKNVSGGVVSIQARNSKNMSKGSGAIIDKQGHVVTNNHVIAGMQQLQVTLSNGQIYKAKLVGTDKTTDLAVLKVDGLPSSIKPVDFADSDALAVGQPIMAIGNPLGYDDTATTGIVSALNRPVSVMDDQSRSEIVTNAVQIDAAINPGNSGGPTFDASGKVIGINSSIAATSARGGTAGSIGIGFAIPSNLVKRVVNEIIKHGSVKHVALGIMVKSVNVTQNNITRGGAQVASVTPGAPAAKGGMRAGDTIVAFNGKSVTSNYSLLGFVRATALGDKATITVVRGNGTVNLTVKFNQEEAAVNGATRQDPRSLRKRSNKKPDSSDKKSQNGNGGDSSDDDDDTLDQLPRGGDDDSDDGGIFDPFGFW
ncbi:trypsin-like peptidase domain-containing protein [Bifidobacterium sp. UMB6791A]|uniref:S1C family serine protease n=1 Tax=Gardnerella pickettii TaxID=2914924 RepID=UPI0002636277|nr:trypsin-like peptidase domain-containing protein [Gardnerella pickettii]EIK86894.1 Trypsin-like serine protease [Gardnerella pickettii 00703C2mash]MDK7785381.1 trypsin-like peptidase domain-containing protein [Bifidobacterium sp. UMB6791B]MDK8249308.1 trypsin-like peptidase domain-containing protein [Bifidobacterium sp. UMB6794B]MDK8635426.1 trypsin-like peptidase domain-containing protein [Bifidobacterium sp. UMB6791A]